MLSKPYAKPKFNTFVVLEALICAGIIFSTVTVRPSMASLFFTASFIVLLIKFIGYFSSKKTIESLDLLLLSIIFIAGFNILVNSFFKDSAISFQNFTPYFIFVATIMLFRLAVNIQLDKQTCDFIFYIQIVISLIYIYAHTYLPQTEGLTTQGLLSLNFSNPNLIGMFLLQSLLFMSVGIVYFKIFLLKLLCGGLTLVLFQYVSETGARNVQLAYVFFLILAAFYLLKRNFKLPKWVSLVLNAAPIIFIPLYLGYINVIENSGFLDFLISDGKSLDSRVGVWNEFFYRFDNSWILGNYAYCKGNSHNALLVVLVSYGAIVLSLLIIFNHLISKKLSNGITSRFQGVCLAAYFSTVFMGLGEGALYSGGLGLYIFPAMFIMLANSTINLNKPDELGNHQK